MSDKSGTSRFPPPLPNGQPGREDITEERMAFYMNYLKESGQPYLTREEREASLEATIAPLSPDEGVWVFGYGSLMWNPAFLFERKEPVLVHGYHRRFCMSLDLGRASPERPGLMLALDRGGSCKGLAFYVPPDQIREELTILWRREMLSGAYLPTWVKGRLGGKPQRLLTFVIDHSHPRYRGHIALEVQARIIAGAEGNIGTNRDYLYNMVEHLDQIGIGDCSMHRLMDMVRARAGD